MGRVGGISSIYGPGGGGGGGGGSLAEARSVTAARVAGHVDKLVCRMNCCKCSSEWVYYRARTVTPVVTKENGPRER